MSNQLEQSELIEKLSDFKGQWFVVNCITGLEEKVRDDLSQKVITNNLTDQIFDIKVSSTTVTSKDKKKKNANKFPGYLFINMVMTDETWFMVRNTPGVTGFIGSSGKGTKPFPLTTEEVSKMILNTKLNASKSIKKAEFSVGDFVNIIAGSFIGSSGKVIKIDETKGVATIGIEFLGRITPTELPFENIEGNS
ncbi:transcription termination/antitermination protein NusG [Spiroplasma endosymbiont of Aspidapion aeneum]|uniref:transcription termination/antitermination protein NusG n=1 Tax=Spiroplasma endosymbiont of Aspidapion aeneum TaxID=3066276 RepID=UPI00313C41EC